MKRYSSALAVVLLLLLATGALSATAVPVGQLIFINDGTQQSFILSNKTSDLTGVYTPDALSFDNLALTVTIAGRPVPDTRVAAHYDGTPVSFLPRTDGYWIPDDGTNRWLWDNIADGLITSATLTGTISPKSFQFGGATFSSTGVLAAAMDLSGNEMSGFAAGPADITVSDAPVPSSVPEPGTLALLAGPVIAFAFRRIRK